MPQENGPCNRQRFQIADFWVAFMFPGKLPHGFQNFLFRDAFVHLCSRKKKKPPLKWGGSILDLDKTIATRSGWLDFKGLLPQPLDDYLKVRSFKHKAKG